MGKKLLISKMLNASQSTSLQATSPFKPMAPKAMAFGAIGLNGEVAWSEVLCEALSILEINNFFPIEPDLNMRAESFYTQ